MFLGFGVTEHLSGQTEIVMGFNIFANVCHGRRCTSAMIFNAAICFVQSSTRIDIAYQKEGRNLQFTSYPATSFDEDDDSASSTQCLASKYSNLK